jgi:hypothetical protein
MLLAKQSEVSEMLDNMQRCEVIEERPLVFPHRSDYEKEWGTRFLRELQEIKRYHKERLFSTARD